MPDVNPTLNADAIFLSSDDAFSLHMADPIAAPRAMRGTTVVAGAKLVQMSIELAEVLHVNNQGAFVVQVTPATPAMRAGLKGGDVIVMAGTLQVTSPTTILQAMSAKMTRDPASHRIELTVVRMGKKRHVTLRR
jgi:S1-C subfamily serine protease